MSDDTAYPGRENREVTIEGRVRPKVANTAGETIDMIRDGDFSHTLNLAMQELAIELAERAEQTGCKMKGSVTIKLDFMVEDIGGPVLVTATHAIKKPPEKQPRTLLWTDESNRFSRSQPRQGDFMGELRTVPSAGPARNIS